MKMLHGEDRHIQQMTLGGLIDELENIADPEELSVYTDFGKAVPGNPFDSYRGFYEDLAIDFMDQQGDDPATVEQFLDAARKSVGVSFYGYKGGLYWATRDTALWVDQYGRYKSMALVGVYVDCHRVILRTWYVGV